MARNILRKSLLIFLSLATFTPEAQNLVPNPNFEKVIEKPCDVPTLGPELDPDFTIERFVKDWTAPTLGTSDFMYSDTVVRC